MNSSYTGIESMFDGFFNEECDAIVYDSPLIQVYTPHQHMNHIVY